MGQSYLAVAMGWILDRMLAPLTQNTGTMLLAKRKLLSEPLGRWPSIIYFCECLRQHLVYQY